MLGLRPHADSMRRVPLSARPLLAGLQHAVTEFTRSLFSRPPCHPKTLRTCPKDILWA
jgi:hypothetical protein